MGTQSVQSVDRAVTALEMLAACGQAGTGEIADHLGVHKSSATRLLATLADHGLVEQDGTGGQWSLGFGLVRLAGAVTDRAGFSGAAQALCDRVAAETGETANVAVLDDVYAVNVTQAVGAGLLSPHHYLGRRTPGHATSSGKLLLAEDAAATRKACRDLGRYTDRTIVTADALSAELAQVRDRGWAVSDEEWEEHITAVAVPLRLPDGTLEAALTVTGPNHRLRPEDFARMAARLAALASSAGRWR
ncbi:IclR family transcriptional regulator [Corynebacterium terpenotabidum]|uniref:Glycerol operon regulatory protein n=1 Tax=Corynebacterium terpenotabidum Y-11 TaxID=1200352 RepID=S4XL18_9CORY|nr:IclR family transcriptional regulator [Corynebacterium terpenotabidum]AGP31278.1 IclR DNA-binding transcription regulator [Corynebacterium terpenotabidum Y-11]